ncbi:MAG: carbamoyl phosphate synthase small subunit, partial [Bacillota bacterium]|nr:carbamoyl phosphate synthase small subunit [Bacillota bacterium]
NYGINTDDNESKRPWGRGFIVRELCRTPSNWRVEETVDSFLKRFGVIGIEGIDTRCVTRTLRDSGVMSGAIYTEGYEPGREIDRTLSEYRVMGAVRAVTSGAIEHFPTENARFRVAVLDFGIKQNIVRSLNKFGCDVTVFPAYTKAGDILKGKFDGIQLTNGPGDPEENVEIIKTVRELMDSGIPIFGICLGHQIIALASGAQTGKLKYGHRGGNQPVKDVAKDRTFITSQNHGYAVLPGSINQKEAEISHINLNDGTVEGLKFIKRPVFTVQFHPEGCPGPMDTQYLFKQFVGMMEKVKKGGN